MALNWTEFKMHFYRPSNQSISPTNPVITLPPSTMITINCIMVAVLLVSLAINLLVIDILIRDRQRQRHYDYFIINITLSNIILTFGNLIYFIVLLVTFHQHFAIVTLYSFCKFILVVQLFPYGVHMITLGMMSFAQHRRLRHRYRHPVSNQFVTAFTIPLTWIVSLTLAMPILPLSDPKTTSWLRYHGYNGFYCSITNLIPSYRRIYFSIYVTITFILPVIVILYSCIDTFYMLNKKSITLPVLNHPSDAPSERYDCRKYECVKIYRRLIGLSFISSLAACPQAISLLSMAYSSTLIVDPHSPPFDPHGLFISPAIYFYVSQFAILFNCYYHPIYFITHDQKLRRRLCCLCYYIRR